VSASSYHPTGAEARTALESAARSSLSAPSVFNTQPWKWRVTGDVLELRADRSRRLEAVDPDGNLMMLSCGAVLHHARTVLAAGGWAATVHRLPDPDDGQLLARVRLVGPATPDPWVRAMADAITVRRTDRRTFGAREVPGDLLDQLGLLVEREGARLHRVLPGQMSLLAVSTDLAATAELDDPDYRADLHRWTSRPLHSGDGVPPTTAVQPGLRRVPVRDFDPAGTQGLAAGSGRDEGAVYVVVHGIGYRPIDLLCGGEAMSALLLAATAAGLSTAPLSDAVEVTWPRHLLRYLLSGRGEPYVVVRLGYRDSAEPLPSVPRRDPAEMIEISS